MKRIFAILICGLFLAGCGSSTATQVPEASSTPTPTATEEPTEEPTETPTPTPTMSAEDIDNALNSTGYGFLYTEDEMTNTRLYYSQQDHHISKMQDKETVMPTFHYGDDLSFWPFQIGLAREKTDLKIALSLRYRGDDWIFFDTWLVKAGDGETHTFDLSSQKYKHDVGNDARVTESYFFAPSSEMVDALLEIVEAGNGTMRYSGDDGQFTFDLEPEMISAIDEILTAYKSVKE